MLEEFEREGFAPFRDEWLRCSMRCAAGARGYSLENAPIAGTARGVDEDGALLLESAGPAAEIRVRRGEFAFDLKVTA